MDRGWALAAIRNFNELDIKKIIHVGDFGVWLGAGGQKYLHDVNKELEKHDMKIYVTLGNHENYDVLSYTKTVPEGEEDAGWLWNKKFSRILYAKRPQLWEWEGVKFTSLGGANSIDRFFSHRKAPEYHLDPYASWWPEEQITSYQGLQTAASGKTDIFISHDCPAGVPLFGGHKAGTGDWPLYALDYAKQSREPLRTAVDGTQPSLLFHGHYHFKAVHPMTLQSRETGEEYMFTSVGLDMNGSSANMIIMELPSKHWAFI